VPPQGIDDRRLSRALEEHWGLAPGRLGYLPVGFGDHHWELTDRAGRRWFVTVAELASAWRGTGPAAGYADLRAAMDTVAALTGAGLEFAVAPVPTAGGQALAPLGGEHAITVFPYLDADASGELSAPDQMALIDMLARLHDATPLAAPTAPVRRPDLPVRHFLETALRELSQPWHGGPYSEPTRQLVARHASPFGQALAWFDELTREAARYGPPVITHGEPHSDNILRSAGRLYLIDWGSAGLALPERDLWDLGDANGDAADRYAELTGRPLNTAMMRMYQLRWILEEIMLSVREFRGPHEHNGDTGLAWEALAEETENLGRLAP
jgi:spectinomycin phosphotransferase